MPSTITRSGRTVKNSSRSQAKLDALDVLARQRRGEKVSLAVKEDEPLFEEVDEEEYRSQRKGGFVVNEDADDEELDDSDLDFIDDEDDYDEPKVELKPKMRSNKSSTQYKSKKEKVERNTSPDTENQPSVRSFFSSKPASVPVDRLKMPVFKKEEKKHSAKRSMDTTEEDILNNIFGDGPSTSHRKLAHMGPIRARRPPPVELNIKPKPLPFKRQKISSPEPKHEPEPIDEPYYPDLPQEDCFEDSLSNLPPMPAPSSQLKELKLEPHVVEEEEEFDDTESQNIGIAGVPLNEDLKTNLEFQTDQDGNQYTRLYWYDCVEEPAKSPGTVYLFGRVHLAGTTKFVSCCTIVKNITKTCYLLIKPDSDYDEALMEFTNVTAKMLKFKKFTCRKVTKKYAFSSDSDIPLEGHYLQIDYPANQAPLPANLTGECFSHVLNLNQSPMEKLILELKLRGPCWLRLIDPVAPNAQITWSKIELVLESPDNLQVETQELKPPYFCAFSLSIRTFPNPITHHNEIIAIAGMVNTTFSLNECLKRDNKASGHFCLMTKPGQNHKQLRLPSDFLAASKQYKKTRFELCETERDLLQKFIDRFSNLDPDIVVGHDLLNFDFETLVARMCTFKMNIWSRLGRFRRTELCQTKAAFKYMFSGRVMCDIRNSAMELIKSRSYDLTELTSKILSRNRREYSHNAIIEAYGKSQTLIEMIHATWEDNDSIFSILVELSIIPLALKITNITGNILSRTLAAGRSERNEYLLLHAFHEANFICPEKRIVSKFQKNQAGKSTLSNGNGDEKVPNPLRKKAAYAGGLVLEPKTGYYDNCILLMDFNSLYPSIIQEFNICFSTVKAPDEHGQETEVIASVPDENMATGILPTQLRNLVEGRRKVKKLMQDPKFASDKKMLDIEQQALKLTANSMYGCLGFEHSRFYAKHLASLVTYKGREILMSTKEMVERLGYEVIYGDTDSLMINTKLVDFDEVIQRGNNIKAEINRTFKLLEIDIDGVYRPLLLLKKKNYAGAMIKKLPGGALVKEIEMKGLDTVRRDRAVIAKEAGELVLNRILNCDKEIDQIVEDIHSYLKQLGASISNNELAPEKFLISKQLNRNPEQYQDSKGVGHVILALRHNANPKNTRKLKAGDTVEYVICTDGTSESANQRAYTIEELRQEPDRLKIDHEYYLCQQIHPVIVRICGQLPTTNCYVIAEMLGVAESRLLNIQHVTEKKDQLISKGLARFHSCEPVQLTCPHCFTTSTIISAGGDSATTTPKCKQCSLDFSLKPAEMQMQVISMIRRYYNQLYNSKLICENAECSHSTRNAFLRRSEDAPLCDLCDGPMVVQWDDRKLDLQLRYLAQIFANFEQCKEQISYALECSFINNIDTHEIFSMVTRSLE